MRTALVLAVLVLTGTGGEIAATRAMKQLGEVHDFLPRAILRALGRAFRIGWMWLGFGLMTLSFICLLTLLSWEAVSFVIPATALSYAVGALGAKLFLGEQVSRRRWMGVLLVCAGVFLVVWGRT